MIIGILNSTHKKSIHSKYLQITNYDKTKVSFSQPKIGESK
jgi:hypothetical protein